MDQLTLETAEEVFGNGVIVGVCSAGHTLADAIGIQPFPVGLGRILHPPVTVEDQLLCRLAAAVCHVQGGQPHLPVYLRVTELYRKWNGRPVPNWALVRNQLAMDDRIQERILKYENY